MKPITFYDQPRHGSVKRAQNLTRDWQLQNIPMNELDPQKKVNDAISDFLKENGEYLARFIDFQESARDYQSIMLATTLTLRDIQNLEDDVSQADWEALVEECQARIGGDAVGFFESSLSDTSSTHPAQQERAESTN